MRSRDFFDELDPLANPAHDRNGHFHITLQPTQCYTGYMQITDFSNESFAAYFAGLLDGEGSIEIHPKECGTRIRIANTNRCVLVSICRRLGIGRVEQYRNRPAHHQPLYAFCVSNAHDCRTVLKITEPYLQIKTKRAAYALKVIGRMQERMDALDERNRQIIEAIKKGEMQCVIASRFGISQAMVSRIKCGHTWPCEIARLNAKKGLKKFVRPKDAIFRLHGDPLSSPCPQLAESVAQST